MMGPIAIDHLVVARVQLCGGHQLLAHPQQTRLIDRGHDTPQALIDRRRPADAAVWVRLARDCPLRDNRREIHPRGVCDRPKPGFSRASARPVWPVRVGKTQIDVYVRDMVSLWSPNQTAEGRLLLESRRTSWWGALHERVPFGRVTQDVGRVIIYLPTAEHERQGVGGG
jgi:hypothetical protein